ncbi:MAG: hypothetical protein HY595_03270 [Candidatus Omnitrophica bacterium]|nr:hypothetical protein [Candidatus Omnitrophota bacterium]
MDGMFLGVVAVSVSTALVIGRMTRGILFVATHTDQEKQVRAAARSREWRWPSDMHRFATDKAWMKDVGLLGVALLQRVLKDTETGRPLTVLALLVHAVSAVLLFAVARSYWGAPAAGLLFVWYMGCYWPYQIVLLGGFQGLAQMLLLGAVWSLQQASAAPDGGALWYVAAGAWLGAMMFASASGRKFLPLAAGAFLYSQRETMALLGIGGRGWASLGEGMGPWLLAVAAVLAAALGSVAVWGRWWFRRLVTAIYFERAAGALNRLITARAQLPLAYYLGKEAVVTRVVTRLGVGFLGYLLACLVVTRAPAFYVAHGLLFVGIGLAALFFTAPNVVWNLKGYLGYWQAAQRWTHYPLYREFFASVGRILRPGEMRVGLRWLWPFFWRTLPFHVAAYGVSMATIVTTVGLGGGEPHEVVGAALLGLLSLSPIVYAELTQSPQCSRTYFPSLVGFLLAVGYAGALAAARFPLGVRGVWWGGMVGLVALGVGWNVWIFVTDVWPARMASTWLHRTLERMAIRSFATYDTSYNQGFIGVWPPRVRERFQIRYVRTLGEVTEGYVVVPSTSAKGFDMSTDRDAIARGDFADDPELNRLFASKTIDRYAVASFKTIASSRMWIHEHDVTSYRDLILRQVGEMDRRWRGRLWVLDGAKLAAVREQ